MNNKNIMKKKNQSGFTLIELLVVIAIIGLLATMSVLALSSARESARDSRRLSDIRQIQTALEMYYSHAGEYPAEDEVASSTGEDYILGGGSIAAGDTVFMGDIPSNPNPTDDGDCDPDTGYIYSQDHSGTYTIEYCIGSASGDVSGGTHCATPDGLTAGTAAAGGCE